MPDKRLVRPGVTTGSDNMGGPCDGEMFDPTGVPDGIEPSDDPVLAVRAEACAASFTRRVSS